LPILYENFSFHKSFSQVKDSEQTLTIIVGYPTSTLQLADILTGKPVVNAKVTADSKTYTSDANGVVVLDLPNGTYTVSISNPAYLHKSFSLALPMAEPLTVKLIPLWGVGLGIVAGATVAVAVVAKLVWRK
jgi:hypothetical protein